MGRRWNQEEAKRLFKRLRQEYDVYAPRLFEGTGCFSDTDVVRYGTVDSFEEIVWDKKSDYSFKEALLPISETIMYFTENSTSIPEEPRKRLIFLRSCELNALERLDEIYLKNGAEDFYYKRIRENAKFVLMGCEKSFDSCFCVSMGTNRCEGSHAYAHRNQETLYLDITDTELAKCAEGLCAEEASEDVRWAEENDIKVEIPLELPADIAGNEIWKTYGSRCIGCGRCNFVCPTCTCFTMQDIFYQDNENAGERRRVWASCQVDGYTDMAGGLNFRKSQGERLRFKVLHKIQDYKKRFGAQMCVGCGRCEQICPEYISYTACLSKLSKSGREDA